MQFQTHSVEMHIQRVLVAGFPFHSYKRTILSYLCTSYLRQRSAAAGQNEAGVTMHTMLTHL